MSSHLSEGETLTFFLVLVSVCGVRVCVHGGIVAASGGKKVATKAKRWYKEVGLGFKTPAEAINGTYIGQ